MVKKSTRAEQQPTEASTADTRRSTRIQGRAVTGQAESPNNTAAVPVKSRPVRKVRQKLPASNTSTSVSDRPRRTLTAARSTSAPNTSSLTSTRHKRKRKQVSEATTSQVNPAHQPASGITAGRRRSKKVKFTQSTSHSRNVVSQQPSVATVQETLVASSVVIQDTTVPQVTTTTPVMQQPKKRGRPPKTISTTTDSELSNDGNLTAAEKSKKRGHYVVEEDHKLTLKPKRRKGDTFTIPIPTRSQQICKVYAIGSNEFSQCGEEGNDNLKKLSHIQALDQFDVVDISAGSIHGAALTVDGKVVTWGCNDHGTLGRFTETPKSAEAKEILETGNYNMGEEEQPAYAEGLDNVNIVKVVCGGNATFAISDQGHLYMTGSFKGKDGVIGFSYDSRIEQPIFTRYTLFEHLTVVDIAAGVDHALALTKEGDVYAWGSNEAFRLGRKFSERRSLDSLKPFSLGLKHIVRLYSGAYHNFAIDDSGKVWVFGYNNMGQCGLGASKQIIVPPEKHLFFNKVGQSVEEFAAGEHHTLARMQDGQVFSFGRSDYGQLGLGDNVLPSANESKARVVIPTAVPNLTSIKFIETGDHFSMAVDTVNKIYAWGFGESYVLGNKKDEDTTSPFRMPDLLNGKEIARISCGSSHALFLIVDSDRDAMDVDTN